ncbi:MAG: hydroxyacid dehydrogenase [Piscinibacter sp.]|nr:hydroxyacid dehydrogenase [Piscinibacter sp.]
MIEVFVSHPSDRLDHYFGARALAGLRALAQVRLNPHRRDLTLDELVEACRGCAALIAYRQTPGPAALFERCPTLGVFLRCAVDIRSVDVPAASAAGVLVTQASPGFQAAVAEWVLGAMVDLGRGVSRAAAAYWRGEAPTPAMGRQLRGSVLGIVGYGAIGQALGEAALALGMTLLVTTPQPVEARAGLRQVGLDELLGAADFVVCLAPATPATEGLMGAAAFAAMKPGAFFINAARGELVDDAALLAALDGGRLAGCALDVGRAPDQMPSPALARHPRVIATPHIGGLTPPAVEHQALETVAQLAALLRGELPPGAVNPQDAHRWRAWPRAAG